MRGRKTGGRQPGTPNKVSAELRAFAQALLADKAYRQAFTTAFRTRTLNPRLEEMIYHYAAGKPTEHVSVTGEDGGPLEVRFVVVGPSGAA